MREAYAAAIAVLFCLAAAPSSGGESTSEFSVQLSASVETNGPSITLTWPQDSYLLPNSYTVYRKAPGGSSWGTGIRLAGTATSYLDKNVSVGAAYEYQVVKSTSEYTGYGYIYAGMKLALTENRGRLLLVVDNTYAHELTNELSQLQQDLVGDGWLVTRLDVSRNDSVTTVKNLIKAQY